MPSYFAKIVCFAIVIICLGCKEKAKYISSENKNEQLEQSINQVTALPKQVIHPKTNIPNNHKIKLGQLLFFDPILSGDKDVACATCHHPKNGYAEFRDISIGVNGKGFASKRTFNSPNTIPFVKRNAHTIVNTAFNGIDIDSNYNPEDAPMFWDSRVKSLEAQAIEPIKALEEMRGSHFTDTDILQKVITRLRSIPEYQKLFKAAFNEEYPITIENIGKAIATFERTLISNNSNFDRYMRGESTAISLAEKEGFKLFKQVGCINCHNGPMFSDYKMHVLSVPENNKLNFIDDGFEKQFSFRTPTLRNLRFTAPYMHNGTLPTLEKVLEFYEDLSFKKSRNPNVHIQLIDSLAQNLQLSVKEMSPIISFLNSLNDDTFDDSIPKVVPSGLEVGGNIN